MSNPLVTLGKLGQSPWYDFITRDLVQSGKLRRLIDDEGLLGMTSNPTIFEKAVSSSDLYDEDIRRLTAEGKTAAEVFESLAVADVQSACDVFMDTYERTRGVDGLVSLEVSPTLARNTVGTIAEAERLWKRVARPNVMIKIPGTAEGLEAITRCLAAGINVNVTLLFAVARYREVIDAFFRGIEQRAAVGEPVDRVASVASFFVSRVDGRVDPELDKKGDPSRLRGTIAIANAAAAYALFEEEFQGPRWEKLVARGAQVQRPLWASTSTKDPKYPDTYYVDALIGPHTVNTLPPETFAAFGDHGKPAVRIRDAIAKAPARLEALAGSGIDLAAVTTFLENDGVAKFAASYASLLAGIEAKASALSAR
ncbi:MAG TPA: transaldolase [Gemmatimonadales bacterium]|nr:transaldolase [Gemmatimonadales bacterium]